MQMRVILGLVRKKQGIFNFFSAEFCLFCGKYLGVKAVSLAF
jgi:hypothetical protein